MKPALLCILLLPLSFPPITEAEYLSAYSGLRYGQHKYLNDAANLNTQVHGGKIDLSDWRYKQKGWLARGFAFEYQIGSDFSYLNTQVPLFHWHKLHGLWFQMQLQNQNMEIELSSNETLLSDSGTTTALPAGSVLSAEHNLQKYSLYWYEATQYKGPINLIGLFYYSESSPVSGDITGSAGSVFDGTFNGFGITLGRIKDNKGLNFQWRLNLAELDMSFSDSSTGHRAASKAESTAYKLGLDFNWHYRYHLAPYWYLVPKVNLGVSTVFQTQMDPVAINYDALNYFEASSWISIQRRF